MEGRGRTTRRSKGEIKYIEGDRSANPDLSQGDGGDHRHDKIDQGDKTEADGQRNDHAEQSKQKLKLKGENQVPGKAEANHGSDFPGMIEAENPEKLPEPFQFIPKNLFFQGGDKREVKEYTHQE